MEDKKILLLTDYTERLSSKLEGDAAHRKDACLDLSLIQAYLEKSGFAVEILEFAQIDYRKCYRGYYVLYASSEEKGQFYKDYIEDVLLKLQRDGAVLLPSFLHFRAHHNKSFAEMLRASFADEALKEPQAYSIGRMEELAYIRKKLSFPCVVKTASGSGSKGVRLVKYPDELDKVVKEMMTHIYRNQEFTKMREFGNRNGGYQLKRLLKAMKGENVCAPKSEPYCSNKIIIQTYIPNLSGDYKVLFYYGKYYVLSRLNRTGDFRASGSGKFSFPAETEEISDILNFAKRVAQELDEPMVSMDLAQNETGTYLIEFQCLYFGTYTLQYAQWYYRFEEAKQEWEKVIAKSLVEEEYSRSVKEYLEKKR